MTATRFVVALTTAVALGGCSSVRSSLPDWMGGTPEPPPRTTPHPHAARPVRHPAPDVPKAPTDEDDADTPETIPAPAAVPVAAPVAEPVAAPAPTPAAEPAPPPPPAPKRAPAIEDPF